MSLHFKLLIGCFLLSGVTLAQSVRDTTSTTAKKKKSYHFFGEAADSTNGQKTLINPFFFPGYSPDIQLSVAGGAIISFKTNQRDSVSPRSSIPITFTYSTIKSFIANAGFTTFWLHDKLRVNAVIQFKVSRDAYYGIGYENAIHTRYPDSTLFWRSSFIFQVRPLWKVLKHLYAGTSLEYSSNILWDVNTHMQKDPLFQLYGPHIYNAGVGGILSYDSRDFPQNAYHGIYSTLIYTTYSKSLGGNTSFQALDFDNRFYIPLNDVRVSTLAINVRSRYDFGQPPLTSMISLGNSQDLRGIHFGQFRDYYMNYVITEYRHKIYHRDGKPSRFGYVFWTGVGAIGDNFNDALFKQALPDLGAGIRFEVQPRLNLRIDFGYAPGPAGNHTGTYFNFLEAY